MASAQTQVGPLVLQGRLGEVEVSADANGNWVATIRYPLILRGARITITAIVISPTGQRSEPTTVEVVQQ